MVYVTGDVHGGNTMNSIVALLDAIVPLGQALGKWYSQSNANMRRATGFCSCGSFFILT